MTKQQKKLNATVLIIIVCVLALILFVKTDTGSKLTGIDLRGLFSEAFRGNKFVKTARPVPGRYIVVFNEKVGNVEAKSTELASRHSGNVKHIYRSVAKGFATEMTEAQARELAKSPEVKYVETDSEVFTDGSQSNATWGLDRIDQRALPLNSTYNYTWTGSGVNVYVVDTGIRFTHNDFGGRARLGVDLINDGQNGNDCYANGHGTHVAGTIGSATYGVAKDARLWAVRVFGCSGSAFMSDVIAGLDWIKTNRVNPAVVNLSIGGQLNTVPSWNQAMENLVASGVTVVVAAGNGAYPGPVGFDACLASPASASSVIAVGATDSNDAKATYSNFGSCVDVFAPGNGITSLSNANNTDIRSMSGTSMASPHVAGAAALYLQSNPSASPSMVLSHLNSIATKNVLTSIGDGSPNSLLFMGPPPTTGPAPYSCSGTTYNVVIGNDGKAFQPDGGMLAKTGTYKGTLVNPLSTGGVSAELWLISYPRPTSTGRGGASYKPLAISASLDGGDTQTLTYASQAKTGSYQWEIRGRAGNLFYLCSVTP